MDSQNEATVVLSHKVVSQRSGPDHQLPQPLNVPTIVSKETNIERVRSDSETLNPGQGT